MKGGRLWSGMCLLLTGLCAVAAGCSKIPAGVVPVSGCVTLDGQPLAGAVVTFQPIRPDDPRAGPRAFAPKQAPSRFSADSQPAQALFGA